MTSTMNGRFYPCLLALLLLLQASHVSATRYHSHLRGKRRLQARQYSLLSGSQIHSTLRQWETRFPNLVKLTTAQEAYGLPTAGNATDCPYDESVGCLNYILTIQDYVVHPEGAASSNALPEVLWSGELHGDERVGPTAVMEAASLLLEAASCEAAFEYNPTLHATCSSDLKAQGIHKRQRLWLARLVSTRRIVIVPTANALGYYQNTRQEAGIDVNRDFPFDYSASQASQCMRSIAGRTLNELFRSHLFQMALTFHGGIELIGYEWGADSYNGVTSPDDSAQYKIATAYSQYSASWNGTSPYKVGPMDQVIYTVTGGMEDWAYAGSWIPEKVVQCTPSTYGGYPTKKTTYNDSMLRAFNMLIETSDDKTPAEDSLGTSLDVLDANTTGNGHVSRNIRLSLLSADLVEPYVSFVGVNNVPLETDILPLTGRNCPRMNAMQVPQGLSEVTVEWTVGGALEIDATSLMYGNWSDVFSQVDCMSQPSNNVESRLLAANVTTSRNGTGYFSSMGASPSATSSSTSESPLGPVFKATIDLSSFGLGDEVIVMVKARVDQSWLDQPTGIAPVVPPQSHIVNARTNSSWFHQTNGKIVQGRLDWYSVIPLTLVISNDATVITDLAKVFEADANVVPTAPPSVEAMPPPTLQPTVPASTITTTMSTTSSTVTTETGTTTAVPVPSSNPATISTLLSTPELTVPDDITASDGPAYADARCSAHPVCLFYGLADDCCPTNQGIYLDCCGYFN